MKAFHEYKEKYGSVRNVRQAFYSKESFNCVIQRQLSKDDDTCKILSYHKKIHSLFSLLEKHQQILQTVITIFDDEDATVIRITTKMSTLEISKTMQSLLTLKDFLQLQNSSSMEILILIIILSMRRKKKKQLNRS